jgi:hypothetical protein
VTAELVPSRPPARTGIVQIDRRALHDDQGPLHGLGLTFFWAYQGETTEHDRFIANLDWLSDPGVSVPPTGLSADSGASRLAGPGHQPQRSELRSEPREDDRRHLRARDAGRDFPHRRAAVEVTP